MSLVPYIHPSVITTNQREAQVDYHLVYLNELVKYAPQIVQNDLMNKFRRDAADIAAYEAAKRAEIDTHADNKAAKAMLFRENEALFQHEQAMRSLLLLEREMAVKAGAQQRVTQNTSNHDATLAALQKQIADLHRVIEKLQQGQSPNWEGVTW